MIQKCWETLQERRTHLRVIIMYKTNNHMRCIPETNNVINMSDRWTRGSNRLMPGSDENFLRSWALPVESRKPYGLCVRPEFLPRKVVVTCTSGLSGRTTRYGLLDFSHGCRNGTVRSSCGHQIAYRILYIVCWRYLYNFLKYWVFLTQLKY